MSSSEINFKLQDEGRLAELGYTQELKREWSLLHNFGASFSIISVITGLSQLFSYGLNTGGPAVMTVGWIIAAFFTCFVGLAMAEILSSIPTSGGPYFWAYMLSPPQHAPFFSWLTGWFNLLGQIGVTSAIDFGLASLISLTAEVTNGYSPTPGSTLGILAVILASHVLVNFLSTKNLRYLIHSSILFNGLGVFCICIAVISKAPTHQSAKFVFGKFFDGTAATASDVGWSVRASPVYVAICGILMTQYTITGYDASAHLCEETRKAVRDAPHGLLSAIIGSAFMGFFVLICLLFSIQDFDVVRQDPLPVLKIFIDSCGKTGGIILMVVVMICVWHCGLFSLTSNSRMMFAFARDGGIPHRLHIIDGRFKSPIRTVAFGATCSFLLALPSLGSKVAFAGTTAIATSGLYISYGIPILLTLIWPRNFKRGPFNLGSQWGSKIVCTIAVLWIGFITITFCLPTVNPVTSQDFNYTSVAVGIVGIWALGSWVLWARHWFTGRCRHHCRFCIRQLDFLGDELAYRGGPDDNDGHQRLKSDEGGPFETGAYPERNGSGPQVVPQVKTRRDTHHDQKINVGHEFAVSSAPARDFDDF